MKEKSLYGIINDDDTLTGVIHQEKYYVKITPIIPLVDKSKVYIKSSILGKTILESLACGWGKIVALIDASAELSSSVRGKGRVQASAEGSASVNVVLGEQASLFDIDVQNWLDLITDKPSAIQNDYVNTMIKDMKSGLGVNNMSEWADVFYHLAAETAEASLKNMVKDAHHAIAVNGPVHTPFEGWGGDGISSCIRINYTPNSHANKLALNSASIGLYVRNNVSFINLMANGCSDGTYTNGIRYCPRYLNNNIYASVNGMSSISASSGGTSEGFHVLAKTASNVSKIYVDKVEKGSSSNSSSGLCNNEAYIGAYNNDGVLVGFDNAQYALHFLSKGLAALDVEAIYDSFQALMTKNGKQV